jgi:ribosomal protein S4
VREWFTRLLRHLARHDQAESRQRTDELQNQRAQLRKQQDHLLNLRLRSTTRRFAPRARRLRDRVANLTVQLEAAGRSRGERADQALAILNSRSTLPTNLRSTCRKSASCSASCF